MVANINYGRLNTQLILHEGLRLLPYDDATGKAVRPGEHYRGKLTIGVGRNLDNNPLTKQELLFVGHDCRSHAITEAQAIYLLSNDVMKVCRALDGLIPWWQAADEVRARVLADMAFNMGVPGLLKFKTMLSCLRAGSYAKAANAMVDSAWYGQVGQRGVRLVGMMVTGKDWVA